MSSKNFLGALPPYPLLLDPSLIYIACIKVPNEYEQPIYVQSVQKNLVGPNHGDTPQIKFECAPLSARSVEPGGWVAHQIIFGGFRFLADHVNIIKHRQFLSNIIDTLIYVYLYTPKMVIFDSKHSDIAACPQMSRKKLSPSAKLTFSSSFSVENDKVLKAKNQVCIKTV